MQPSGGGSERVEYHHPDRLGTRLVTSSQDGSYYEQVTLPYGIALDAESTGASNRRFTSYDRSAVTGLDYAINRHYDPLQGRFTQVDPTGMKSVDLTDPQTLNLYAYCANDPINQIDPDGLFFKKLFGWIGKALKWAAVGLLVAAAVATTLIVVAPVGSVLWKVGAWLLVKALPVAAKYLGYVG
ncbi:MAG: RHS repeat-associated core domain-containing protein, partial [Pyrinomonas methylaliphatogenes]|nr:RHS repeat-associated core domain-containing protein [Pyrinomonas methylaliphatogenes]